jgi:iron(III) transport system ATP-binding protein
LGVSIAIENLTVEYAGHVVLDSLSLNISDGCFFTLLGPSGCGKTTLLRTIAGFLQARHGKILFAERDVTHLPPHKRDIGMVFQDYALFPNRTVFENVAYGLRARKINEPEIKKRVSEALERVGLVSFSGRLPAALSGGQRQRVALARALVIKPQVLLMDEPLSNLDAKLRVQIRDTIRDLQREAGITTVFVTHDQEEALALSDQIGVMDRGRLRQIGAPGEIYRTPQSGYVADFVGGANILPLLDLPLENVAAFPFGLLHITKPQHALTSAVVAIRPEDIHFIAEKREVNHFTARVLSRSFLGDKTAYRLTLEGNVTIIAHRSSEQNEGLEPGTECFISIDQKRALMVEP